MLGVLRFTICAADSFRRRRTQQALGCNTKPHGNDDAWGIAIYNLRSRLIQKKKNTASTGLQHQAPRQRRCLGYCDLQFAQPTHSEEEEHSKHWVATPSPTATTMLGVLRFTICAADSFRRRR